MGRGREMIFLHNIHIPLDIFFIFCIINKPLTIFSRILRFPVGIIYLLDFLDIQHIWHMSDFLDISLYMNSFKETYYPITILV